jgi:hypothetical protein
MLLAGEAVPPSAFLDREWNEGRCTSDLLMATLASVDVDICEPVVSRILELKEN